MSSPARLLLISGTPGAGATTIAEALAAALAGAGMRVRLIEDDSGTHARAQRELWPLLASGIGAFLQGRGADPLAADEVGLLPGMADLARALHVARAAAEADAEVLVWDAGCLDSLLRAATSVSATSLLLDRYLTPASLAQSSGADPGALEAVQDLQAACERAEHVLWRRSATHLVMRPTRPALARVTSAVAALAMWGCSVDRVVLNGVPEPGSGWPEPWAEEQRAFAEIARAALAGIPGCRVEQTGLMACPAEEHPGPFERLATEQAGLWGADDSASPAGALDLVEGWIRVEPDGPGYRLSLVLPCADRSEVRVGRSAERLVLGIGHHRRSIRLPAHLRRCALQGARLDSGVLTIRMRPDPSMWGPRGPVGSNAAASPADAS